MLTQRLVEILESLPEKRLKLLEVAGDFLDEHGAINPELAAARLPEIEEASREADTYAQETRHMVALLRWLVTTPHG